MKRNLPYSFFTAVFLTVLFSNASLSQTHINREWIDNTGSPDTLIWSSITVMEGFSQTIHIGHTLFPNGHVKALITVYKSNGTIDFQDTYAPESDFHFYGVKAVYDSFGDIYVFGSAKYTGNNASKLFLVKYSNSGTLLWDEIFHSGSMNEDIATDILLDNNDIYLSAASKTDSTDYDYLCLKFSTNGNYIWSSRFDYSGLVDFPVALRKKGSAIGLIGASAIHPTRWHYTLVDFNDTTGAFIGETRNELIGNGFDMPASAVKDALGNTYITGRSSTDGFDYDVRTIKIDNNNAIEWSVTYDFLGLRDEGLSIDVDTAGNVYVGGYVTRAPNVTDLVLLKYDNTGDLVWEHRQSGDDPTKNAKATVVQVTQDGYLYFAGYEHKKAGKQRAIIGKYSPANLPIYQRRTKSFDALDEFPTGLRISADNSIYMTTIQDDNSTLEYATRRYTEFTQNKTPYFVDDTIPVFRAQEIIVRFKQNALETAAFYPVYEDRRREFDSLQKYLTTSVMGEIDDKLGHLYPPMDKRVPNPMGMKAVKVFRELTPNLTTTTNRLGETIRVPDFWTTLLISFPTDLDIEDVYTALNDLPGIIAYAEPNYYFESHSEPNDPLYSLQKSINNDVEVYVLPNEPEPSGTAGINIERAWDIYPDAGRKDIKCGVIDAAINFYHPDFGYTSPDDFPLESQTKIQGYDYFSQSVITASYAQIPWIFDHGTEVAGIIGAIRNNEIGIAGIAGGNAINNTSPADNDYFDDKGVSLFSCNIYDPELEAMVFTSPIQSVYDALVTSAILDDTIGGALGVHLNNNSYGIPWGSGVLDTNFILIRESVHFANRMNVAVIASRGNSPSAGSPSNAIEYPACLYDSWVMNVGGTNNVGEYTNDSNKSHIGREIDFSAPSVPNLIRTTFPDLDYGSFAQTSAAAAHVSGVVALMMSYYNDTLETYENLAPEDCEQILELTAENYANMGQYSDSIGWGKINAGAAFELIDTLWNRLHHFGNKYHTNVTMVQQTASGISVNLKETTQNYADEWFSNTNYSMNVYKVTATVYHEIDPKDTIYAYWPRPSSSDGMEAIEAGELLPRQQPVIEFIDRDSCIISGYVYELLDGVNTIGWLPRDTVVDSLRLEYTILAKDTTAPIAYIENLESNKELYLYPNPSSISHTISLKGFEGQEISVGLYDLSGRKIRETTLDNVSNNHQFNSDIASLSPGLYVYAIRSGNERYHLKFIKQ